MTRFQAGLIRGAAILAIAGLIVVIGWGLGRSTVRASPTARVILRPNPLPPPHPNIVQAKPDFPLRIRHNTRLPEEEARFHRQISDQLNQARIGVPAERVRYFESLPKVVLEPIGGWDGAIESITPIEAGYSIDLFVTAGYGRAHNFSYVYERYTLIRGEVRFVKFWLPKNQVYGAVGG